jgi:hypothetical protein
MKAMIGASAVAASLLVMVEPSGTGLEGVWAALAVLMVGRLATLSWRYQSADGPLPPTHLQQQQQLPQQQQQDGLQEQPQDSSPPSSQHSASSSSRMAAAEMNAPLLLLNNSVEGSSGLRSRRRLAVPRTGSSSGSSSGGFKKVHNGVSGRARKPVSSGAVPAAAKGQEDSSV